MLFFFRIEVLNRSDYTVLLSILKRERTMTLHERYENDFETLRIGHERLWDVHANSQESRNVRVRTHSYALKRIA